MQDDAINLLFGILLGITLCAAIILGTVLQTREVYNICGAA